MRFLIVNMDYPPFLRHLYHQNPGLQSASYDAQLRARNETFMGIADFYSTNLRALGRDAHDIYWNNQHLQHAWARENAPSLLDPRKNFRFRMRRGVVPWLDVDRRAQLNAILEAQIRAYRPDILLVADMKDVNPLLLHRVRADVGLVVGQRGGPPLPDMDLSAYDLAISSFMPRVEWFRSRGLAAEFLPLGFEPRVLTAVPDTERDVPVSFVGSFHDVHSARTSMLAEIAERVPLLLWGEPPPGGFENPHLRRAWQGQAWGIDMFRVLRRSRIVFNHHGDVGPYANNMRMYEATGCGAVLLTDQKPNLTELFQVGTEVVEYEDVADAIPKIEHLLDKPEHAQAIAHAGQSRTLRDHTYLRRMESLLAMLTKYT